MEDDDNEQGGPEEAEEKDDGKKGPKKKFEVKKWNAVALWAWDIVVDNCAICRNHIMDLCMCKRPVYSCFFARTLLRRLI
jgi:RING-box protein 1